MSTARGWYSVHSLPVVLPWLTTGSASLQWLSMSSPTCYVPFYGAESRLPVHFAMSSEPTVSLTGPELWRQAT